MTAQPHLTGLIVVIVIGAGALHAVWNAIAKQLGDRVMVFALMGVPLTLAGGLAVAAAGVPARAAVGFAIASAVIHIGYDLALMNSYRLGSFNQVYPIARGTSPLVVAAGAYLFASERLGAVPLAGVAILAFGLMSLALSAGRLARPDLPAVGVAVLTGLTIAAYTIVDGLGVRAAHDPYAYAGLMFLLQGPVFPLIAVSRRPVRQMAGQVHGEMWPARRDTAGRRVRHRALGAVPGPARRGRRDQGDQRDLRGAHRDDVPEGAFRDPPGGGSRRDRRRHCPDHRLTSRRPGTSPRPAKAGERRQ